MISLKSCIKEEIWNYNVEYENPQFIIKFNLKIESKGKIFLWNEHGLRGRGNSQISRFVT